MANIVTLIVAIYRSQAAMTSTRFISLQLHRHLLGRKVNQSQVLR